jgi:hypothetical protein
MKTSPNRGYFNGNALFETKHTLQTHSFFYGSVFVKEESKFHRLIAPNKSIFGVMGKD